MMIIIQLFGCVVYCGNVGFVKGWWVKLVDNFVFEGDIDFCIKFGCFFIEFIQYCVDNFRQVGLEIDGEDDFVWDDVV